MVKHEHRRGLPRRWWVAGAGATGMAGAAFGLYRAAPSFWRQYWAERNRPVSEAAHEPTPSRWPDRGLHAAWVGHATVLLKIDGFTILTDPVFSERAGIHLGLVTLGVKRLTEPALQPDRLPRIDLVLLSHAHMDHFDIPSLRQLESPRTTIVTARATSDLLRPRRYRAVHELGWGERVRVGPVTVQGQEVNHWGARMRSDTWRGYGGYLLRVGRWKVLFAGDTADTHVFSDLRSAGGIDLAVMPIGAYNPWIRYHCTPEQAWRMGGEARSEFFLPVHHKTFSLGREPQEEPVERLIAAAGPARERVVLRSIGQEFHLA